MVEETSGPTSSSSYFWKQFIAKANNFMKITQEHALEGVNPGGYYTGIWCRDASYILRDWFLTADGCRSVFNLSI
jgi:hypothetical protein